jgi:hypothetical protein
MESSFEVDVEAAKRVMATVNPVNCALTAKRAQTLDAKGIDALCTRSLWYALIDTL